MRTKSILPAALLLGMITSANATIIDVTPWVAPNVFGSPSYAAAEANAIYALYHNLNSYGAAGPTQFNAQSNVTSIGSHRDRLQFLARRCRPGAPYQNEFGNRMHFGLRIDGQGSQFSISQLSFAATSTDPLNALAFSWAPGSYNYGAGYQGILKGQDAMLFTGDDIFVTSGPNTQLVDGLVGRGSGNSFAAYCPGCTVQQQQAEIDAAAAYPGSGFTFTGVYTLGAATGDDTFHISAVPETSTWVMMILGFAGIAVMARAPRAQGQEPKLWPKRPPPKTSRFY